MKRIQHELWHSILNRMGNHNRCIPPAVDLQF
ncbi:hypothetical protein T03_11203 [Trichinella britovi]|uniref:Uncharacterized protein n=1 Tax=Trichinella britovi TaxID=45882 RepID=A0A0V1CSM1_TRIBR|nr:hypothetical protein T03_11203 [Trichinella britovi]